MPSLHPSEAMDLDNVDVDIESGEKDAMEQLSCEPKTAGDADFVPDPKQV